MYSLLQFSAPRRDTEELPNGKFCTKAWTKEAVLAYRKIGGWFVRGNHDFADKQAAEAAMGVMQ